MRRYNGGRHDAPGAGLNLLDRPAEVPRRGGGRRAARDDPARQPATEAGTHARRRQGVRRVRNGPPLVRAVLPQVRQKTLTAGDRVNEIPPGFFTSPRPVNLSTAF